MNDVFKILRANWPLFFGLSMIMIANGLQGTLLGVRATIEDFSYFSTGAIMSSYFAGFFLGSRYVPNLVSKVGHIRVFTALASLASGTVLINGLIVEPVTWVIVRLVAGFAYAGMGIVVESWVNSRSNNKIRGKLMGVYVICGFGSMFFGQFLMNVADPQGIALFAIASLLVSIAVIPLSLSARPAPDITTAKPISLKALIKASPTALMGIFVAGITGAAIMTIGPVFAIESGMSVAQTSMFIAIYILGGVLGQIPLGQLSDKIGRRSVIIVICVATLILTPLCAFFHEDYYILCGLFAMLGFFTAALYPVCSAYTHDRLTKDQMVGASSRVIIVSGLGSLSGPILVSIGMTFFGPIAFFLMPFIVFTIFTFLVLGRSIINPALPLAKQTSFILMPMRATSMTANLVNERLRGKSKKKKKKAK